jgi:hypothetical protein
MTRKTLFWVQYLCNHLTNGIQISCLIWKNCFKRTKNVKTHRSKTKILNRSAKVFNNSMNLGRQLKIICQVALAKVGLCQIHRSSKLRISIKISSKKIKKWSETKKHNISIKINSKKIKKWSETKKHNRMRMQERKVTMMWIKIKRILNPISKRISH